MTNSNSAGWSVDGVSLVDDKLSFWIMMLYKPTNEEPVVKRTRFYPVLPRLPPRWWYRAG